MTKRGRPPLSPELRQSRMAFFRVTEQEWLELEAAAGEEDTTVSDYVRKVVRRDLERRAKVSTRKAR